MVTFREGMACTIGIVSTSLLLGVYYLIKPTVKEAEISSSRNKVTIIELEKFGRNQVLFQHPYKSKVFITPKDYSEIVKRESYHSY